MGDLGVLKESNVAIQSNLNFGIAFWKAYLHFKRVAEGTKSSNWMDVCWVESGDVARSPSPSPPSFPDLMAHYGTGKEQYFSSALIGPQREPEERFPRLSLASWLLSAEYIPGSHVRRESPPTPVFSILGDPPEQGADEVMVTVMGSYPMASARPQPQPLPGVLLLPESKVVTKDHHLSLVAVTSARDARQLCLPAFSILLLYVICRLEARSPDQVSLLRISSFVKVINQQMGFVQPRRVQREETPPAGSPEDSKHILLSNLQPVHCW